MVRLEAGWLMRQGFSGASNLFQPAQGRQSVVIFGKTRFLAAFISSCFAGCRRVTGDISLSA